MQYDTDKVDDAVLALLTLTVQQEDAFGARAWKGHDWDVLNRLHEKGFLVNPISKAKSVVITPEGLAKGRALFETLFAKGVSIDRRRRRRKRRTKRTKCGAAGARDGSRRLAQNETSP